MISFDIVKHLSELIEIKSLSKKEENAATFVENILSSHEVDFKRLKNNIYATNKHFSEGKYTLLLNSHLDTVKPNIGYTVDPYQALIKDEKLYGLGSNDAGGCLMALLGTFLHYYNSKDLPFNLVFAASAEEEISGINGMEYLFPQLPKINFAIVGEPTKMQIAIAERGLMVLDVTTEGVSGHAARKEGVNALYKAMDEIQWFKTFEFDKVSPEIGEVSMNVTMIDAGTQHNVVPDRCTFVVDVRINDLYTNKEVLQIIETNVEANVKARSTRLNSSGVSENHAIREVAKSLNVLTYGSPTSSDQALIPCESIKMGPGDSARSHTANEFIYVEELTSAIAQYIKVLDNLGEKIS